MAEILKKKRSAKAKAAAQPKSTDKPNGTQVNGAAEPKAAKKSNLLEMTARPAISHEQVAMLAFQFWSERGCAHGRHEEDWRRAEEELRSEELRGERLRGKAS
ncbi:MAG: DUF2934 domain-containing protein [Terracidiphilus sp.]